MNITIPAGNTVLFFIGIIIGVATPVISFCFIKKAGSFSLKSFWCGCAVYIVFALLLENIFNNSILNSAYGAVIQSSIITYSIYSGFMGALFEDVGRFLAFKTVMKKHNDNDLNALVYSVGHGGFEIFLLLILPMITYIRYSMALNGSGADLFNGLSEEQTITLTETLQQLASASPFVFIANFLQRIASFVLQASVSVLTWFAAKDKQHIRLLPIALLIHTAINSISVILGFAATSAIISAIIIMALSGITAYYALRIWKSNCKIIETINPPLDN